MELRILFATAMVVVSACGSVAAPPSAIPADCTAAGLQLARAYGANAAPSAGSDVTAAQLAAWQERAAPSGGPRALTSPWRSHPPTEHVTVCYYDGDMDKIGLQPAAATPTAYTRILVFVSSGRAQLFRAGTLPTLPIEDPSAR